MRQALRVRGTGRGGKDPGIENVREGKDRGIENVRDQRLPQVQVRWRPCGRGSPEDGHHGQTEAIQK